MRSKFHIIVAVASAIVSIPTIARAQSHLEGDNKLFVECTSPYFAECTQYLLGVWDGMMTIENAGGVPMLCPGPAGVNGGELRLIFIKWAKENPAALSSQRRYVAAASFIASFPCKRSH